MNAHLWESTHESVQSDYPFDASNLKVWLKSFPSKYSPEIIESHTLHNSIVFQGKWRYCDILREDFNKELI